MRKRIQLKLPQAAVQRREVVYDALGIDEPDDMLTRAYSMKVRHPGSDHDRRDTEPRLLSVAIQRDKVMIGVRNDCGDTTDVIATFRLSELDDVIAALMAMRRVCGKV
jgi:hypothetical protein